MKYIRTIFGTICTTIKEDPEKYYGLSNYSGGNFIEKKFVIKEANTIVELCDYVFLFNKDLIIKKIYHEDDEEMVKVVHKYFKTIKFAILTSKGLIYVAKVNKEGEVELI